MVTAFLCSIMQLSINPVNCHLVICVYAVHEPTVEGSCADLLLSAVNAGHSTVSISFEHVMFDLRATTTVAAYRPLKANFIITSLF